MKQIITSVMLLLASAVSAGEIHVYFGTGGGGAKGIYRARFDQDKGRIGPPGLAAEIAGPGFLALHPDGAKLYAVARHEGIPSAVAYEFTADGGLRFMNASPIGDGDACHLAVHPSGRLLLTAQYGGGSVAVFPLDAGGTIGPRSQLIEHSEHSGVVAARQEAPHPHWCGFSPDGRFAFVPDLGADRIVIYAVDPGKGVIEPRGHAEAEPGAGPRHMRFSPDGRFIYLLNELGLSVTTFAYDAAAGTAVRLGTVPTLPEAGRGGGEPGYASEILVHPTGRFVYAANRGHDSVSAFAADPRTGALTLLGAEPIRGAWPRNIALDPSGRWLFAAGEQSGTISVLRVDDETGRLAFHRGSVINIPSPMCVLFH